LMGRASHSPVFRDCIRIYMPWLYGRRSTVTVSGKAEVRSLNGYAKAAVPDRFRGHQPLIQTSGVKDKEGQAPNCTWNFWGLPGIIMRRGELCGLSNQEDSWNRDTFQLVNCPVLPGKDSRRFIGQGTWTMRVFMCIHCTRQTDIHEDAGGVTVSHIKTINLVQCWTLSENDTEAALLTKRLRYVQGGSEILFRDPRWGGFGEASKIFFLVLKFHAFWVRTNTSRDSQYFLDCDCVLLALEKFLFDLYRGIRG
jgi:hypothetical protein